MELTPIDKDYEARMLAFEVDCFDGKGEPIACHRVGEYYSVVANDHVKAAKVYQDNCSIKNYSPSCFNLGRLFLAGRGVEQNDETAERLFGKACEGEHLPACYRQAQMLYASINDKDISNHNKKTLEMQAKGVKLMEQSCDKGLPDSCYLAGQVLIRKIKSNETHLPIRNPIKAIEYFERSCAANHAPSCFNLAVMYKNGDVGISKSEEKFAVYKKRTDELVGVYGSVSGTRVA